jgi:hypothetical protein
MITTPYFEAFTNQVDYLNRVREFAADTDQFKLIFDYRQRAIIKGLLSMTNFPDHQHLNRPLFKDQEITFQSNTIGFYNSIKPTQASLDNQTNGKYYCVNVRNSCDDKGFLAPREYAKRLTDHLEDYFGKSGYPEYVFLLDSAYTPALEGIYQRAGWSSIWVASIVRKDALTTGTTILTRKSLSPQMLQSLVILPNPQGLSYYHSFDGRGEFDNIALHTLVGIDAYNGQLICGWHQSAAETVSNRNVITSQQLQILNKNRQAVDLIMTDCNKYGVDTVSYNKAFLGLMKVVRNPALHWIPYFVESIKGKNPHHKELSDASIRLSKDYPQYKYAIPNHGEGPATTFLGDQDSIFERVFAALIKNTLDIAVVNTRTKWYCHTVFPSTFPTNRKIAFTDHFGLLVQSCNP